MSSHGDPALAFGPKPGPQGGFSWANGSRLYYANLAFPLSTNPGFKGASAAVVSRTDNVQAAASGCSERMDGPGDRQPPERRAAVRQGGHLGRQRFLEPVLRQRLCVQHGLPQRRRRSGADRGFGVGGWRQHLAAAPDHPRPPTTPRPAGVRAARCGPTATASSTSCGRAPTSRPARASSTWPARPTAATTSRSPEPSPRSPTSGCSTPSRVASCSTATPGPAPTASPA